VALKRPKGARPRIGSGLLSPYEVIELQRRLDQEHDEEIRKIREEIVALRMILQRAERARGDVAQAAAASVPAVPAASTRRTTRSRISPVILRLFRADAAVFAWWPPIESAAVRLLLAAALVVRAAWTGQV